MSRVIAGSAGGRRLVVPTGKGTRPTSDRAREGLFSSVGSLLGSLDGARVMDLYAGSGAVGLEALSRGAAHALLVEADAKAVRAIRTNVKALGLPGAEVVAAKVERVVAEPCPAEPYDLVFLDPPYAVADEAVRGVLALLAEGGWLAGDALVAVERETRGGPFTWPGGFEARRDRRYGEATFWYGSPAS
ncbi:16S rRNA (guanine(966)-N(2))-methyltransferase RsmD [Bailinhaonella thermotolerans]|uniref:16S rRNA (Guanine(966)-N(2))-methyltransferase RsmD n=1 Tax=Bailinhaonella thermotolerans TaxID=1070861 RepID=A0A3A4AH68_9ACTN|nr:16S rRNA (guanine(966)-N(2))-methyltransferase RsmD [Bailinhaonella thermotolerans]RJL25043.1 16S rRNA (guanine(966)-N(2))-methyltransferase RsmD [Bailinhaonella thermotolerans]